MNNKGYIASIALVAIILALVVLNILYGAVHIPAEAVWDALMGRDTERLSWNYIIWESRLPQTITALICGASLAASGLMLQTVFNNPLADSSILGISSGASLGVAIVMLTLGGQIISSEFSIPTFATIILGALLGALLILSIILFFSTIIRSNIMLLIVGIMIGYITSSVISLLNFFSTAEGVHSFMIWGLGNFGGVSLSQLPAFTAINAAGLLIAILLIKPLNALLLGPRYAENLGINIRRTRNLLLLGTGLLTAATTAFCGPISFIGLAVPHIARLMLGTSNHNQLMPVTILTGSTIALVCNLISVLPGESGMIPLNAITPLIGAPIIIYVIINQKKIQYFN